MSPVAAVSARVAGWARCGVGAMPMLQYQVGAHGVRGGGGGERSRAAFGGGLAVAAGWQLLELVWVRCTMLQYRVGAHGVSIVRAARRSGSRRRSPASAAPLDPPRRDWARRVVPMSEFRPHPRDGRGRVSSSPRRGSAHDDEPPAQPPSRYPPGPVRWPRATTTTRSNGCVEPGNGYLRLAAPISTSPAPPSVRGRPASPDGRHRRPAAVRRACGQPSVGRCVAGSSVVADHLNQVHVTRRAPAKAHRGSMVHSHLAELDADDVVCGGTPTGDLPSLGPCRRRRIVPFEQQRPVIVADAALRLRPDDARAARRRAEALDAESPGARAAGRVIAFADGRSESVGESRSRVMLHRRRPPSTRIADDGL